VRFASMTLCVASQCVFVVAVVYFVIDSVRKLLDTPSHCIHITVSGTLQRKKFLWLLTTVIFPNMHAPLSLIQLQKTKLIFSY
jgi:hypothetical protein